MVTPATRCGMGTAESDPWWPTRPVPGFGADSWSRCQAFTRLGALPQDREATGPSVGHAVDMPAPLLGFHGQLIEPAFGHDESRAALLGSEGECHQGLVSGSWVLVRHRRVSVGEGRRPVDPLDDATEGTVLLLRVDERPARTQVDVRAVEGEPAWMCSARVISSHTRFMVALMKILA